MNYICILLTEKDIPSCHHIKSHNKRTQNVRERIVKVCQLANKKAISLDFVMFVLFVSFFNFTIFSLFSINIYFCV